MRTIFPAGMLVTAAAAMVFFLFLSPANAGKDSLDGRYVGYSWAGEARGVEFKDADRYVETVIQLDDDGIIVDAKINFFTKVDGFWTMRQSGNAMVIVDYSIDPEPVMITIRENPCSLSAPPTK